MQALEQKNYKNVEIEVKKGGYTGGFVRSAKVALLDTKLPDYAYRALDTLIDMCNYKGVAVRCSGAVIAKKLAWSLPKAQKALRVLRECGYVKRFCIHVNTNIGRERVWCYRVCPEAQYTSEQIKDIIDRAVERGKKIMLKEQKLSTKNNNEICKSKEKYTLYKEQPLTNEVKNVVVNERLEKMKLFEVSNIEVDRILQKKQVIECQKKRFWDIAFAFKRKTGRLLYARELRWLAEFIVAEEGGILEFISKVNKFYKWQ